MTDDWRQAAADFVAWQTEQGTAAGTIRRRGFVINRYAARTVRGPWDPDNRELETFQAGSPSPASERSVRDSLTAFYRWAAEQQRCAFPDALLHRTVARARRASTVGVGIDPAWSGPAGRWLEWLRAGGVTENVLSIRLYQLTRFSREMTGTAPWAVTTDDLAAWLAGYPDWKPETMRSYRAFLRSFYGWAHANGEIDRDPAKLLRKVPSSIARPRPAAETVVESALAAADDRTYLALMLGAHAGLRRAEIAQVRTTDLIREFEGWSLLVHGKGRRQRVVPLLDEVALRIREAPAGWVFPNGLGSHITPAHVGVIVRRVMAPGTTTHQLRHRFASAAYQATGDIRAVQELLGHASVATTQIYTQVGDQALRRAVLAAGRRGY